MLTTTFIIFLLFSSLQGSAFRCLKTGEPIDVVLEISARESGVPISDILENLPAELSVWVDPGEVSYRIGEKGAVKVRNLVDLEKSFIDFHLFGVRFSTRSRNTTRPMTTMLIVK